MDYWIKDVRDEEREAYQEFGEGDIFNLHWPGSGRRGISQSEKISTGDIILLKQNQNLTHLVKMIDPTSKSDSVREKYHIYRVVYCIRRYQNLTVKDVFSESNYDQGNGRPITIDHKTLKLKLGINNRSSLIETTHYLDYSLREFPEGEKKYQIHQTIERNQTLVRNKKKHFKEKNLRLYCEICKFDFRDEYGQIGEDFIEAHHLIPVSNSVNISNNTEDDLILVCSNCHRMIHRLNPFPTELQKIRERLKKEHLWMKG